MEAEAEQAVEDNSAVVAFCFAKIAWQFCGPMPITGAVLSNKFCKWISELSLGFSPRVPF
jgi:hypothetical protein